MSLDHLDALTLDGDLNPVSAPYRNMDTRTAIDPGQYLAIYTFILHGILIRILILILIRI